MQLIDGHAPVGALVGALVGAGVDGGVVATTCGCDSPLPPDNRMSLIRALSSSVISIVANCLITHL
jgi:hypothetical protein